MNSTLLKSIEVGAKLKKTQTSDRSAPIIEKSATTVASAIASNAGSISSIVTNNLQSNSSVPAGGLFQGGFPTLKKTSSNMTKSKSSDFVNDTKPSFLSRPLKSVINAKVAETSSTASILTPSSPRITSNTSSSPQPLLDIKSNTSSTLTRPLTSSISGIQKNVSSPHVLSTAKSIISNNDFPKKLPNPPQMKLFNMPKKPLQPTTYGNPVEARAKPITVSIPTDSFSEMSIQKSHLDISTLSWNFPTILPNPRPFPKAPRKKSFFGF